MTERVIYSITIPACVIVDSFKNTLPILKFQDVARQEAEAAKQKLLMSLVERKLAKGQTGEQIAEDLFEPVEYIRELLDKSDN